MGSDRFDVIVVGGRVAGSTLAALLGRAGFSVLLLERVSFPSDTLSTHVVYGDSFGIWERIGVWDDIKALGAAPLSGIAWTRDGRPDIRGNFWPVRGHDYALCLRRLLLDERLFNNAAATPGVTAISEARVAELLYEGQRVVGVKYQVRSEQGPPRQFTATARLVAGCDGRKSTVARQTDAPTYRLVAPINFAFYTYLQGVDPGPEDVPMFEVWESEAVGGTPMLAQCDQDVWMAIIYLPQDQFEAFRRDKEANFWLHADRDERFGPRLRAGRQLMPVKGAGDFTNYMRAPAGEGWVLVGDSGQFKDPIYGQGIGDAVRSAELLSDCLVKAESAGRSWAVALAEYWGQRDLDLLPNFDWMIEGRPAGLTASQFESILETLGADAGEAERFVNIFSHGMSASEFFGRAHAAGLLGVDPRDLNGPSALQHA